MAVKTINTEMLRKGKEGIHQRIKRIPCPGRRYRYKYDSDDHVSSKRGTGY